MTVNEILEHRGDRDLSPASKQSVGCKVTDSHLEDVEFTMSLNHFAIRPVDTIDKIPPRPALPQEIVEKKLGKLLHPTAEDQFLALEYKPTLKQDEGEMIDPKNENNEEEEEKEKEKEKGKEKKEKEKEEKEKENPFFIHVVTKTDTLVGLALRYGVSVDEIKRANFLTSGQLIWHRKNLRIPTHGRVFQPQRIAVPTHREIASLFKNKTGCKDLAEAKYYLEDCEYDMETALKHFEEDKKWENENETRFHNSVAPATSKARKSSLQYLWDFFFTKCK